MKQIKILVLFVISLLFLTGCDSHKTIVNGLDQAEANEILVFLSTKNIQAIKIPVAGGTGGSKKTTFDIAVSAEQASEAMSLLNQVGLPRRASQSLLDIFSSSNLVPSEMQEQIRYQAGLASQIASTIRKIDGVLDAEVQISFPKEDPLNPNLKKDKITASVYVKYAGMLEDPNVHLTSKIKRLVAASVTGLEYDNVTVILDRARFGESTSGASPLSSEDKSFVKIWTVTVAQDSLTRFRAIFFSFSILILLLILSLIWLVWKFYPVLKNHGGFKELLRLHPIHEYKVEEVKSEAKSDKEKDKKEEPGDREIEE